VDFEIFNDAGVSVWGPENQTLTPSNGIVSTRLGVTSPLNIAFDTQYWLKVTVAGEAMTPKIRLTTSPYAFIAKFLDTGAAAYGALSVAETVTANKFVGNGSLLTGVTASGAADTDWTIATASTIYRLSGNVAIGTTSTSDSLQIEGTLNVDSPTLYVDAANNRVGIGTTSPSTALDVNGVVTATSFVGSGAGLTGIAGGAGDSDWTMLGGTSGNIYKSIGNVGIGTASPTDSLHVIGPMRVMQSNVTGTFVIDTNGNVGIGTTTPGARLSLGFGDANLKLAVWESATEAVGFGVQSSEFRIFGAASGVNHISLGKYDKATDAWTEQVRIANNGNLEVSGAALGSYISSSDGMLMYGGALIFDSDGTYRIGSRSIYNTGAWTEHLRMNSTGNVGIGTTTPQGKLDVSGNVLISDTLAVGTSRLVVSTSGNIGIGTTTPGDSLHVAGRIQMDTNAAASAADGAIRWSGSDFEGRKGGAWVSLTSTGSDADTDWTITASDVYRASGNVGIGTSSPSDSLHVAGTVRVSDSITVGDTVFVVNSKSGNVGVGTGTPSVPLDVVGNIRSSGVLIGNVVNPVSGTLTVQAYGANNVVIGGGGSAGGSGGQTWTFGYSGGKLYPNADNSYAIGDAAQRPSAIIIGTGTSSFAGNVGIGTETPGAKFDVSGGAHVSDSFAVGGPAGDSLVVTRAGNVGIGTTAPGGKLDVVGSVLVSDSLAVGDTRLVVLKSGNVGIGTASPSTALQVNGTVTATSFVGSGAGLTGIASSPDTDWTMTATDIYRMGGKVGIGTAGPADSLHVLGTMRVTANNASGTFVVNNNGKVGIGMEPTSMLLAVGGPGNQRMEIVSPDGDAGLLLRSYGNASGTVIRDFNKDIDFFTSTAGRVVIIKDTGNVGIGTVNPTDSLHVVGSVKITDSVVISDTVLVANKQSGFVGIGTSSPSTALQVNGTVTATAFAGSGAGLTGVPASPDTDWTIAAGDTLYRASGNVGIGTTTPTDSLHIVGRMRVMSNNGLGRVCPKIS